LDKLLEYKRNWIQHANRTPRNWLPSVVKHYCPTGRRNHDKSLKRLLVTWDQDWSTSGPTPWQIYDDHTHTHTHIYIYMHTYVRTHTHTYKQNTCIHIYIHTYIHIHKHTYTHVQHIYTYTHTYYLHTYINTYINTYTHTCIHTHIFIPTYIHTHTYYVHKYIQHVQTFLLLPQNFNTNCTLRLSIWILVLKQQTYRQTHTYCCLSVCPFVFQTTYFLIIKYSPLLLESVNRTVTL